MIKIITMIAAIVLTLAPARADEPYPGYEKGSGYSESQNSYRPGPATLPAPYLRKAANGWMSSCGRYITANECRAIRAKDAERAARATRRRPVREERIYTAERRRVRDTLDEDIERDRRRARDERADGDSCKPRIRVTGEERGSEARAMADLEDKFRLEVSARDGYRYVNIRRAQGWKPDCGVIRRNKLGLSIWVCSVNARPCRSDN